MLGMEIFEDSRVVSRSDLAAWLRQLAGQLESDGKVLFGAAGSVTVGDEVQCELEIESSGSETSIEIEFSWKGAVAQPSATDEDEESGEDEESSEGKESGEDAEADAVEDSAAEEESSETAEADAAEPASSAEEETGGYAGTTSTLR